MSFLIDMYIVNGEGYRNIKREKVLHFMQTDKMSMLMTV